MLYKTIVLRLLEERPRMYRQLQESRRLPATLNRCASELKTRHEAWKECLTQARPGSDPGQIASEAAEIALQELKDSLPTGSPRNANETLSLDEAMAFLRRPSPPA